MNNWQTGWPTETGMYWFHGWCFKKSPFKDTEEPKMHLVVVHKIHNGVIRMTEGHFLYKVEGAEGMWLKAELPTPPKEVKAR